MKIRCRLGWHNWTMWSEQKTKMIDDKTAIFHQFATGTYAKTEVHYQDRRCQDCRILDIR